MRQCQFKLTQQGAGLVDALISAVLVSALALGVLYATSTAEKGHRNIKLNNLVIIQMREILQSNQFPDPSDTAIPASTYTKLYDASGKKCYTTAVSSTAVTLSLPSAVRINFGSSDTNRIFDLTATCSLVNSVPSIKLSTTATDSDLFGGILEVGNGN